MTIIEREVCSEDEPYDNNRACIAVYFLRPYNIPLFAAFRIRATKNNPLQVTSCTRDDCWRHAKCRWAFQASSTDGHFNVLCKIQKGNWKFDVGSFPDQYNRGHLVPCALGKKISVTIGAATFDIFNVGPQQKQANSVLSSYEDNMIKFATEKCLDTAVITGNVVRDFYFISGTSPDLSYPNKWIDEKGVNIWGYPSASIPKKGSNVPGFFWTAGCCVYKFPDQNDRRFAITVSYHIENDARATGKYRRLSDFVNDINILYRRHSNNQAQVQNVFGSSACNRQYWREDIMQILNKQYSWVNSKVIRKRMVNKVIRKLKPDYPLLSDYPYKWRPRRK